MFQSFLSCSSEKNLFTGAISCKTHSNSVKRPPNCPKADSSYLQNLSFDLRCSRFDAVSRLIESNVTQRNCLKKDRRNRVLIQGVKWYVLA